MSRTKRITVIFALIFALLLPLCSCGSDGQFDPEDISVIGAVSTTQPAGEDTGEITSEKSRKDEPENTDEGKTDADENGEDSDSDEPETKEKSTAASTSRKDGDSYVGDSFFDDAVFIGDSVTMALRNYVTSQRNKGNTCLADAKFLTAGSMGYSNSLLPADDEESIRPKLNGKKVTLADGVKQVGAKKVFIMLGMNDFAAYNHDTAVNNAEKAVKKILAKNPDVEIYIQSITPVLSEKERGKFTNDNIDDMNERLEEMCAENGWTYLDVNSVFKDSDGCFIHSYCSDPEGQGIHMNSEGCEKWVDFLNASV